MHFSWRTHITRHQKYRKKQTVYQEPTTGVDHQTLIEELIAGCILRSDQLQQSRSAYFRRGLQKEIKRIIPVINQQPELKTRNFGQKCGPIQ